VSPRERAAAHITIALSPALAGWINMLLYLGRKPQEPSRKKRREPAKRAAAHVTIALSPALAGWISLCFSTWGLRPRLYANTRFAG
jgi:hypothetical protein